MRLLNRILERKGRHAEQTLERAWDLFENRDYSRAIEEFSELVKHKSESSAAWLGFALCQIAVMEREGADEAEVCAVCMPMLERAISLHGRSGDLNANLLAGAHLNLGLLSRVGGKKEAAWSHYKAAIRAAPESPISADALNELAALAVEGKDWETAERLLSEALKIVPRHEWVKKNLEIVQRERETLEIVFHILFPLPGAKRVIRVRPEETLGEIAGRVLPKYGLPPKGGSFIYSDDDAVPGLGREYREPHQTIRELGVKERDTIAYFGFEHTPPFHDSMLRSARENLAAGRPAPARREIRWTLESVERDLANGRLEEAESLAQAVLKLEPENPAAQHLHAQIQAAIDARDADSAKTDGVDWQHSHGGPARTGQAGRGPVPPLEPLWDFRIENALASSPVAGHGCVYVAAWNRNLYCLDAQSGRERWRWTADTALKQAPVAGPEKAYAVDREGLNCLAAEDGRLLWRMNHAQLSSPVLFRNRLIVAAKDGTLRLLNAETGRLLSELATGERGLRSLALDQGRVLGVSNRAVVCADESLQSVLWRQEGRFDEAMPVLALGNVYLGTFEEGLWCLEAETGRLAWIFATEAWIRAAPAVGRGRVFFGDTAGRLGCLDAFTGELLWVPEYWNNRWACSSAPAIAEPFVYFLLDDGILYCLDMLLGVEVWRGAAQPSSGAAASLAITAQAIYCCTREGRVACLGYSSPCVGIGKDSAMKAAPPKRDLLPRLEGLESAEIQYRDFARQSALSAREMHELNVALCFLVAKRLDEGIAILRQLERDHPDEERVLQNLARACESKGLVGDALAAFDHILELNPGDLEAFASLGRLLRTHLDIVQEIYGAPHPVIAAPQLSSPIAIQPGLAPIQAADCSALTCRIEASLAEDLRTAPAWYWWLLLESSHCPVLQLYVEFDHQPYRKCEFLISLDIAEDRSASWLHGLQTADALEIHIYDQRKEYRFSRRLNFGLEQRTRVGRLIERARSYLSALPATQRDFQAAVQEAQELSRRV